MKKEDLFYDSRDGEHKVHAIKWIPDGEPVAVLQLIHGMAEYIDRYNDFATFMAQHGYLVVGNDHLGHGRTAKDPSEYGCFCNDDPATVVVRDVHRLKKIIKEQYPDKKYFFYGHSMGAILLQNYLFRYGSGIDGAIVCGTASQPGYMTAGAKVLLKTIALFKGWNYRSPFANGIVSGNANARIPNVRTKSDWLSKDEAIVDAYEADPACGFMFAINGLWGLIDALSRNNRRENIEKIPRDLPIRFISGKEDPIGAYGAGVERAVGLFKGAGLKNVTMKLYEGDRHELLNEIDRAEIYEEVLEYYKALM